MRRREGQGVVVFTPTKRYGGIDIAWASLRRQSIRRPIHWLVADELAFERLEMWSVLKTWGSEVGITIEVFKVPRREGAYGNLAASYNHALRRADKLDPFMFVSMQDYVWLHPDAFRRADRVFKQFPTTLYTALLSLREGPEVVNPGGHFTTFAEPLLADLDGEVTWKDVRGEMRAQDPPGLYPASWMDWEINFAAVSPDVLRMGLSFDETFDNGLAYDHQVYAWQAMCQGASVVLDTGLENWGLDHRRVWPASEQEQEARRWAEQYMNDRYMPQIMRSFGLGGPE